MWVHLNREIERLKTFKSWPLKYPNPKTMAATGLFYTGVEDITRCYFCKVDIYRWKQTDCPIEEHFRLSYNCPLMRRSFTRNIPIEPNILDLLIPELGSDVCGSTTEKPLSSIFFIFSTFITFYSINKIFKK